MKEIYKTAFGAKEDKIFNIGCPRTDIFFNKYILQEKRNEFFKSYPELSKKKLILYAPTFRDNDNNTSQGKMMHLDIKKLLSKLNDNYVLGIRLHPHLANKVNLNKYFPESYQSKVFDFSLYDKLNTLLICSDILITDYSSIIYEYSLLEKPMIFYCYDLDKFEKSGRGFYGNYKSLVPGPIAFKTEEIVDIITNGIAASQSNDKFLSTYLENCDGNATKRLYHLLMENII